MKYFNKTGMKYWDDFENRVEDTINALKTNSVPKLKRLSLHITEKCNMFCSYCNEWKKSNTLPEDLAYKLVKEYSEMGGGILLRYRRRAFSSSLSWKLDSEM